MSMNKKQDLKKKISSITEHSYAFWSIDIFIFPATWLFKIIYCKMIQTWLLIGYISLKKHSFYVTFKPLVLLKKVWQRISKLWQ